MKKKLKTLREEEFGGEPSGSQIVQASSLTNRGKLFIKEDCEGNVYIERRFVRNKVKNLQDSYEEIQEDGTPVLKKLTLEVANQILDLIILYKKKWSDAFVIGEATGEDLDWSRTEEEHKFTSTGIKFWRHKSKLENYREEKQPTVISSHISPEGNCNLRCSFCSVSYRDTHSRIVLPRIKDYVEQLKTRGLKATILSGGGEPVLYPQFNELVSYLKKEQDLSIGLITNGTQFKRIDPEVLKYFSWIRVSINIFDGWEDKIGSNFDHSLLDPECVVGCSMVYTVEHESSEYENLDRVEMFKKVSKVADKVNAQYIRLLPNCLLEQNQLLLEHKSLQKTLSKLEDPRFFQQYKVHGAPDANVCHQAYFRPYLSEEPWHEDGEPGTVYPCDSVVLNDSVAHFAQQYQLCKLEDVGNFMDKEINMRFNPKKHCRGCVFTENVNLLEDWKKNGTNKFEEYPNPLKHEEFV